jgi:hypothetical protein
MGAMRRTRTRQVHDPHDHPFGVGVQVHVPEAAWGDLDAWEGEPTGVIVSTGTARPDGANVPGPSGPVWVVAFDAPQYRRDGRGPFEQAEIRQSRLVAAEPISDDAWPRG